VTFSKLHELDNDLVQHVHLENNILFPRSIAMEKELLESE
jgi:regulator of cell morphogenesis and NO signaling